MALPFGKENPIAQRCEPTFVEQIPHPVDDKFIEEIYA